MNSINRHNEATQGSVYGHADSAGITSDDVEGA